MSCDFRVGQAARLTGTFTDVADQPVDPTNVYFKWLPPGGTQQSYEYGVDAEVVKTGTGVYYVDLPFNLAGTWLTAYEGTGNVAAYDELGIIVGERRLA